ncbi:hypothetical protein CRYUN_Cryun33cG0016400 [Craigia yunnanensis]
MDWMAPRDKDLELDLENGVTVSSEEEDYSRSPVSCLKKKAQLLLAKVKEVLLRGLMIEYVCLVILQILVGFIWRMCRQ